MGMDDAEVAEKLPCQCSFQVHGLMCAELMKLVNSILRIFPEIEAARPRCSSGIQALCMLNGAIEKTKLMLQYCSDSSKLYLAITGDVIVLRCQKSRSLLEKSLSQIQSMVPVMLAVEISQIIDDLRAATFVMDSSEEEAGKMVRELLQQGSASESRENSEIRAIQFATTKLHITSPRTLLIERRSIKKQLDAVGDNDSSKKMILKYLMYLLKKYGKFIMKDQASTQREELLGVEKSRNSSVCCQSVKVDSVVGNRQLEHPVDTLGRAIPPEEYKCPISMRVMFDPVVIASGQTYERQWIRKWFDEGNVTCPKTNMRLSHLSLTPNTSMKDLISKWCIKYGISLPDPSIQSDTLQSWEYSSASIASLGSSMNDLHLPFDLSNVSVGSLDTSYNSDSSHAYGSRLIQMHTDDVPLSYRSNVHVLEAKLESFLELPKLQWESQCKVVEDVRNQLKVNDQAYLSMSSQNFIAPLIEFLRDAHDRHDLIAQKDGCQLLLALASINRDGIPYFSEDTFSLLQYFLDSEVAEEALAILEVLSDQQNCASKIAASGALASIIGILDSQIKSFREQAVKILCNLSSHRDICTQIASLECIPRLVPLMGDDTLRRYCVEIMKNLLEINKARVSFAETDGGIACVASVLENGSRIDQEHAVDILLSLCSEHDQYCYVLMEEGIIPALVHISINGSDRGMACARELLRLLRENQCDAEQEYSEPDFDATVNENKSSPDIPLKEKKSSGFFGRKLSIFSKSNSAASKKKK